MSMHKQTAGLTKLATEVAGLMPGWTVEALRPDQNWPVLAGEHGERLMLRGVNKSGHTSYQADHTHVEIYACYPDGYREVWPEIARVNARVVRTRGPAAVVDAIRKRVLPRYLPELKRAQEGLARQRQDAHDREAVRRRLITILPDTKVSHSDATEAWLPNGMGTVRINHDGSSATFKLDAVPIETAERIMQLLAGN